MTREEKQEHWNRIVREAYRSRIPITRWCAEHNIRSNHFHRWSKKLGYTKDGKKTEKCLALIESQDQPESIQTIPAVPLFVEVPAQALGGFVEAESSFPANVPLIMIQTGSYQIGVLDGFNEQTLSKVLGVIRHA
ncbi:MAG: hypothetical protein IKF59_01645 [Lachnospiraceae bacterium]|nr:hypothetical protein [Eubacterium sp.]MBR3186724.1 hypothetical protein [Lachnospiraceae bacterium]